MTVPEGRKGSRPPRRKWIVVRNWNRFQHYRDRQPRWIKNYIELVDDPAYLTLTEGCRALLHGLWLIYASSRAQVPLDTRSLSRRLNLRVTSAQLEQLNHAGFIEFSASKPLAEWYGPTRSRRESLTGLQEGASAARLDGGGERPKKTRRSDQEPRYLKERT